MWDVGPLLTWDISAAVRMRALGCFDHSETGEPLLLPAPLRRQPDLPQAVPGRYGRGLRRLEIFNGAGDVGVVTAGVGRAMPEG